MAHFEAPPTQPDDLPAVRAAANARAGLWLFAAYALFYGGFMAVNAFAPRLMGTIVIAGLNLALVWGLGLILVAFLLALVYAWICRVRPKPEGRP